MRSPVDAAVPRGFRAHVLPWGGWVASARLPDRLHRSIPFERLWDLHPPERPEIHLHGRRIRIPRWQQAFGHNYHFSGRTSAADPIPGWLEPLLQWGRDAVCEGLNGLLLNWYDGRLGHYIGRHRDSTRGLVAGTAIVTVSLGEERLFRLRPWPRGLAGGRVDLPVADGSVVVIPWETNLGSTHEVPRSRHGTGRRVSVTLRAFAPGAG